MQMKEKVMFWLTSKGIHPANFNEEGQCIITDENGLSYLLWLPQRSSVLHLFIQVDILDIQTDIDLMVFSMSLNLDPIRCRDVSLGYNPDVCQILASAKLDIQQMPETHLWDQKIHAILEQVVTIREELEIFRLQQKSTTRKVGNDSEPMHGSKRAPIGALSQLLP